MRISLLSLVVIGACGFGGCAPSGMSWQDRRAALASGVIHQGMTFTEFRDAWGWGSMSNISRTRAAGHDVVTVYFTDLGEPHRRPRYVFQFIDWRLESWTEAL